MIVDLFNLASELGEKSDDELMALLQDIRQNRRTPVTKTSTPRSGTKTTSAKKSDISLDALLASDPSMKDKLLAILMEGKK
jgi:hypothetical protein